MKPFLPDITLGCVESLNVDLAILSLQRCLKHIQVGDAVLITDYPHSRSTEIRTEIINPLFESKKDYEHFCLKKLPSYIKTEFLLTIEWDSFVIHPECWTDEFYKYDYIGAKWPWHTDGNTVGNGGFSLKSKKLLNAVASLDYPGNIGCDVFICRTMRKKLEDEYGIKFAPEHIADKFSYERHIPQNPTFGFHGSFNFWRHIPDEEIIEMIPLMADYVIKSSEYAELLMFYYTASKFKPLKAMYTQLSRKVPDINLHLQAYFKDFAFTSVCVQTCEGLLKNHASVGYA